MLWGGTPFFEEGSTLEQEFLNACVSLQVTAKKHRTYWYCTGEDLYRHPFHYLSVQSEGNLVIPEFMDQSTGCGYRDQRIICRTGITQRHKVTVTTQLAQRLNRLEFVELSFPRSPRIYLITRRVKNLLTTEPLSGCQFIPCLDESKVYIESQKNIHHLCPQLESEAQYFQLRVTITTAHFPFGGAGIIRKQCPQCGTVQLAFLSKGVTFQRQDLADTDFQYYNGYCTDNIGEFHIDADITIVSARVQRLLIEHKIRGLFRYLTDPPIRYGVVEIC